MQMGAGTARIQISNQIFPTVHRHLRMSLRAAAFGFRRRGNLRDVEMTQEREIASPKTGSQ
jgi:hypothetical protein